jgi:hypothetical protein
MENLLTEKKYCLPNKECIAALDILSQNDAIYEIFIFVPTN